MNTPGWGSSSLWWFSVYNCGANYRGSLFPIHIHWVTHSQPSQWWWTPTLRVMTNQERRRWHHGPPGAKPIGTHRIYWIELFNKCLMVNTQLPAPGALTKPWRAAVRPQTGCPVFVCLFGDSAVKQSVWPTSERHRETERDRERKREGERERERERKRETKR